MASLSRLIPSPVFLRGKGLDCLPEPVFSGPVHPGQNGDGPAPYHGGEGVHCSVQGGRGVVLADSQNPVLEVLAVTIPHKAEDSVFKGVVHDRVELAAGQVFPQNAVTHLVGGVLPHFADQQFIIPVALDSPANLRDKRVWKFIRNVQPEAVRARSIQVSITPPFPQMKAV